LQQVALTGGVAQATISTLAVATHSITAVYTPTNANFATSTSKALSQTIGAAATSTVLTSSAATAVWGQSVTFTATVSATAPGSGTPTGSISFYDGATLLKQVTLTGGVAQAAISTLAVGTHSIKAVYSPANANFTTSTSAALTETINKAATTTTLSAPATVAAGQSVTLTATVTPVSPGAGVPTGTVTFRAGTSVVATVSLSGGVATLTVSPPPKGTYQLTATYNADPDFLSSVSATLKQVLS
jgi:hypothetical protein